MTQPANSELWQSDPWRREATRWIDESLERRGVERVPITPRQPRVRAWSTQLVVDTTDGRRMWFKACAPSTSPEPAIYRLLRSVAPDRVPEIWAADDERGWLLMTDEGPELRQVANADSIVGLWSGVLRRYAQLQRASVEIAGDLVAAGVPRWSPDALVHHWVGGAGAAHPATHGPLREAAARLASVGLPDTIELGDLHAGNVFCAAASAQAVRDSRFFDWGDAYVGNPLSSLMIALAGPAYHFGMPADPDRDARLARAYVSVWADLVPSARLLGVLPDAMLIARLARIRAMERALEGATVAERAEWAPRVIDTTVRDVVRVTTPAPARADRSG